MADASNLKHAEAAFRMALGFCLIFFALLFGNRFGPLRSKQNQPTASQKRVWLCFGGLFLSALALSRRQFDWRWSDTFATFRWIGVFTTVATLAWALTVIFGWTLRRLTKPHERSR